jgi:hypothetical protein
MTYRHWARYCSVPNQWIEQIQANVDDYARALHGVCANSSAVATATATTALQAMIAMVGPNAPIRLSAITSAHAALSADRRTSVLRNFAFDLVKPGAGRHVRRCAPVTARRERSTV